MLSPLFQNRILPVSLEIARTCAALHVPKERPEYDALIAASALGHNLTVVTRNVSDFNPTSVPTLNPWDPHP